MPACSRWLTTIRQNCLIPERLQLLAVEFRRGAEGSGAGLRTSEALPYCRLARPPGSSCFLVFQFLSTMLGRPLCHPEANVEGAKLLGDRYQRLWRGREPQPLLLDPGEVLRDLRGPGP